MADHLQIVLGKSILGHLENLSLLALRFQALSALFGVLDLALQVLDDFTITALKQNHLVWDNAHLKKSEGLTLGTWEAFNDIVNLSAFEIRDDVL